MKYKTLVPWSANIPYHTGVDLDVTDVESFAPGVVIEVGPSEEGSVVTVQYDSANSLRYGNLKHVDVSIGDIIVEEGILLGRSDKFMHFEYITSAKGTSLWPVRIGTQTYFKQDPTSILNGEHVFPFESNEWYSGVQMSLEGEV